MKWLRDALDKSNMRAFIAIWALGLFTYAFLMAPSDDQYRGTLIGLVTLATGIYIGRNMKDDD